MFTGIIRELGRISDLDRAGDGIVLTLTRPASFTHLSDGDSVAVNGACLTVLSSDETTWQVRLMHETLAKTNLGMVERGATVNLERPVAAGERFDGHFVQGHVDGVAGILEIKPVGADRVLRFRPPAALMPFFVPKGSISLNGVSLTIVEVLPDSFTSSLMPYTLEHTTFGSAKVGDLVNIEVDMIAKHVAHLLKKTSL
jgi:riboflavin synthase